MSSLVKYYPSLSNGKTYIPERKVVELRVEAVCRGKVGGTLFSWLTASIVLGDCLGDLFPGDVNTAVRWAVEALRELAERITGLSGFHVGEGGRRDGGGAKGESEDGAGVHVETLVVGSGCVLV
jgi:hypothetical protein